MNSVWVLSAETLHGLCKVGSPDLDVMFRKLLSKRTTTTCCRVDCVIYGHLSVLMIEPAVYVLATLFQDLLAQDDGGGRSIREEVVLGNRAMRSNGRSAIVTEMKDARLDPEPLQIASQGHTDVAAAISLTLLLCS
jgi:hypothetical protein